MFFPLNNANRQCLQKKNDVDLVCLNMAMQLIKIFDALCLIQCNDPEFQILI